MNSLKIPESGVMLKSSRGEESDPLPEQAFPIPLSDNVIEDMIKCVQGGGGIQLALGPKPTFHYGAKSHRISPPPEDHPCDLYLTQPYNSLREGTQIPAMSLFRNLRLNQLPPKSRPSQAATNAAPKIKGQRAGNSSVPGLVSDIEALQNGMAAHDAAKERSVLLSGPLNTKKTKGSKLTWGNRSSVRSLSTSPAVKPIASPSASPAFSHMERAKQQRVPLVHELAANDQTAEYLRSKWKGKPEDFQSALEKVADYQPESKKWTMRSNYYKELDVWKYDYESETDRNEAIKHAVKHYDKQRVSTSSPEWERLNAPRDRNKGICLSKIQTTLAKGPKKPEIKVDKADESSSRNTSSKDDGEAGEQSDRSRGEPMARSSSNQGPKKISGSEAQAKRLLGKNKTSSQKTSIPKGKPGPKANGTKANGGRFLSEAIIENSDSSGDEAPPPPKPAAKAAGADKTVARPTEKQAPKPVARPRPADSPLPKPAPKTSSKRGLEDDDSSSSSGTPLSKRMKPKQPLPSQPLKKRPVDVQVQRDPAPPPSRNKNNSPTKSSPLASSPPTNASDMSDEPPTNKKRKGEEVRAPAAKRHASGSVVPPEVVNQAQRFMTFYSEYEALHHEISALENPPKDKLRNLRDMRDRLAQMKANIYKKCKS